MTFNCKYDLIRIGSGNSLTPSGKPMFLAKFDLIYSRHMCCNELNVLTTVVSTYVSALVPILRYLLMYFQQSD